MFFTFEFTLNFKKSYKNRILSLEELQRNKESKEALSVLEMSKHKALGYETLGKNLFSIISLWYYR